MTINNADMPANPSDPVPTNVAPYYKDVESRGLTKREHFAGLAMQGLLSNSGGVIQANNMSGTAWCNSNAQSMAKLSIECADALLKELEK